VEGSLELSPRLLFQGSDVVAHILGHHVLGLPGLISHVSKGQRDKLTRGYLVEGQPILNSQPNKCFLSIFPQIHNSKEAVFSTVLRFQIRKHPKLLTFQDPDPE